MMLLIPTPDWATPLEMNIDLAFPAGKYSRLLAQREDILAIVCEAVQAYVDRLSVPADREPLSFPVPSRLSGRYYLAAESYWVNDEPWFQCVGRSREYRFSFLVHCLELPSQSGQPEQDYLGLEVHFTWEPAAGQFIHHGDVDSSCI